MDERDIFLSNEKSKIFYILLLIDNIEKIGYPDIIHFLLYLFFSLFYQIFDLKN